MTHQEVFLLLYFQASQDDSINQHNDFKHFPVMIALILNNSYVFCINFHYFNVLNEFILYRYLHCKCGHSPNL